MTFKSRATAALHTAYRCLVVDDESAVREAFNLALSDDYTLDFAEDGRTALHSLGRYPIDLVILDCPDFARSFTTEWELIRPDET